MSRSDYKNLYEGYLDNTKNFKESFQSYNYFSGQYNRTLDSASGTLVNCAAGYYGYYGSWTTAGNIDKCYKATNASCVYNNVCGVYPKFLSKLRYFDTSKNNINIGGRLVVKVGDTINIGPVISGSAKGTYANKYKGNLRFSLLISESSGYETFDTSKILPPNLKLISSEGIIMGTINKPTKNTSPLSDGTRGWYYPCTILMIFKDDNGVEIFQQYPLTFEIREK
jgi:hypothetical protein